MNRGTLRTFLRRALMEDSADNWTDTELNDILNVGAQSLQDYVLGINPEALLQWSYADIVASQRYYKKPAGMRYEVELGIKKDAAATSYTPMTVASFSAVRRGYQAGGGGRNSDLDASPGVDVTYEYSHAGSWFYLSWDPAGAITEGLESIFIPEITMGDDTESPDIALGLHYGIVIESIIIALHETPEDDARWLAERERIIRKIPLYYRKTAAGPDMVFPDVRKASY